jgi:hypothetical protein
MATGDSTLLFDGQTSYIEPSVSRFARSTCWPAAAQIATSRKRSVLSMAGTLGCLVSYFRFWR